MGIESSTTPKSKMGISGGSIHSQTRPVALGTFHLYIKKTGCLFGCSHRSLSSLHCRSSDVGGPRSHSDRRFNKIDKTWNRKVKQASHYAQAHSLTRWQEAVNIAML